ncbi:MAG: DUF3291 domain-containing protein [Pseudonocardiales bacterium]|nr:MAG: DUF3291 domain-containing protein [Pseudonocardiales bacterium]
MVPEPGREYVVMASRLPLARYRHIPSFLRSTNVIRRQLATSDGLIGYALDARPLSKTFFTVSAWQTREALGRFSHAEPHRNRIEATRPLMLATTFVFWTALGSDLPIAWNEVRRRIADA